MSIEGVLLDLDNTVYDYNAAHKPAMDEALSWLAVQLGVALPDIESVYKQTRIVIKSRLQGLAASHSRLLYFQSICEHFKQWPCEMALEAESIYWSIFFEGMIIRENCLEFLSEINRPIAIVTDLTSRIQFEKINKLGLQSFVNAVVTSEEAGREKPHPEIFTLAAKKLAMLPSQLCMIGDNFERDIAGAASLGISCFWLCDGTADGNQTHGSLEIKQFCHFSELNELVNLHG